MEKKNTLVMLIVLAALVCLALVGTAVQECSDRSDGRDYPAEYSESAENGLSEENGGGGTPEQEIPLSEADGGNGGQSAQSSAAQTETTGASPSEAQSQAASTSTTTTTTTSTATASTAAPSSTEASSSETGQSTANGIYIDKDGNIMLPEIP